MIAPVVDPSWWRERCEDVALADVRWYLDGRSGREAYDRGHVPGAVFVDLDRWLAGDAGAAGRHPLPAPEVFARGLSSLGIGDDDIVVAYDDAGGVHAARLVWLLRAVGQDAALLDGGLASYTGELERTARVRSPARRRTRPWPDDLLAGSGDAADRANVVLDARDPARYRGEVEPIDPRGGHIPGARSHPGRESLDVEGRFLPADELRWRFAAVGVEEDSDVVSYCGSGVTACHTLLALERAGLGPGRLYPGSWSEWSLDADRPAATGGNPG